MACAPTQIHMSQHALIDGFFAFWALLCLVAALGKFALSRELADGSSYGLALCAARPDKRERVLCLVAVVASLSWPIAGSSSEPYARASPCHGCRASPRRSSSWFFWPAALETLITTYRFLVAKDSQTHLRNPDRRRPLVSLSGRSSTGQPGHSCFSRSGQFSARSRQETRALHLSIFIAASYLVMCNVKYGMNLRYANMWDMPLRFLAFGQIVTLVSSAKRYQKQSCGDRRSPYRLGRTAPVLDFGRAISALRIDYARSSPGPAHSQIALEGLNRSSRAAEAASAFNASLPGDCFVQQVVDRGHRFGADKYLIRKKPSAQANESRCSGNQGSARKFVPRATGNGAGIPRTSRIL